MFSTNNKSTLLNRKKKIFHSWNIFFDWIGKRQFEFLQKKDNQREFSSRTDVIWWKKNSSINLTGRGWGKSRRPDGKLEMGVVCHWKKRLPTAESNDRHLKYSSRISCTTRSHILLVNLVLFRDFYECQKMQRIARVFEPFIGLISCNPNRHASFFLSQFIFSATFYFSLSFIWFIFPSN